MSFRWLKPYMPRSLYGRAILILLLPVVTLMLVVSVVFIQRHFEGVTIQMTNSVSREVRLMLDSGMTAEEVSDSALARTLLIRVDPVPQSVVPEQSYRRWYDFTGATVIREFTARLPDLLAVDLPDDQRVSLFFESDDGPIRMTFDRRRVSASNPHQLLVNMVGFAAIMTVIAYFYLRNQLRPITRLARAAEAFGRGRHLEYRPAGAVEVRAAGNAFLDMRARIERQIEQRTLMLSGVSHDLRTPLTRLKLGLSMLDDEDREAMEQDVTDMERLIDEFLDFARGASEGEAKPVDPVALVAQIVEDMRRAERDVTLYLAEGEGTVALRSAGIRRAVENLVNNAVRYGTRAEVSVLLTDKSLRIRVEDDGPGIPKERREEAVKPFVRLDTARNQNLGSGVGLGLSIATDIARAHGGMLRLGESERLGGLRAELVIGR
ncbi:ATP-binding protein [Roseovarius sp.]|jgi:two-component system osmolarity sensor histidine kinase EnvZ|uniref:ATP-binding protein n=1 Tax=Roseovarius sp. TaxID=1486281 RepID=UPI0026334530|nr:ATP-binding protein [Roseovarius sp.]MDM8167006.1 ATP-binding protein [Roseovarius sp.]